MSDLWLYGDDTGQPEAITNPTRLAAHLVRLGDWELGFDTAKDFTHQAVPALRDTIATSVQADDSLFTSDGAWVRYGYSWHHGAGAEFHDFGPEQDPYRFRSSAGIDPWTPGQLRLLPAMRTYSTDTFAVVDMVTLGQLTYVLASTGRYYQTYSYNAMTQWSTTIWPSAPTNGQCMAWFAGTMYLGTATGIYTGLADSSSFSAASSFVATGNWTKLAFVGDRLLGVDAGVLKEISAAGVLTTIYEPFDAAGFTWTMLFALGSRVYAGGHDGRTTKVWSFEVDSTGTLVRSNEVADFAAGELVFAVDTSVGVVVMATNRGVRLARPAGDGTLEYGPLVGVLREQEGESKYVAVTCSGRWAFAMKYGDAVTNGRDVIVRFDLSTFTSPLAPAWVYDVMVPSTRHGFSSAGAYRSGTTQYYTAGLRLITVEPPASDLSTAATWGSIDPGVVRVAGNGLASQYIAVYAGNVPYLTIQGAGVWSAATVQQWEGSGELTVAPVAFGTVEAKRLYWTQVVADELAEGEWLGVRLVDEAGRHLGKGEVSYGLGEPVNGLTLDTLDVTCEDVAMVLSLRGPETSSPVVRRWKLRGIPVVPPVEEWVLPLSVYDVTLAGGGQGQQVGLDVAGFLTWMYAIWRAKTAFTMQLGTRAVRVRLDQFQWKEVGYGPDPDVPRGRLLVRLVSV